MKPKYKYWFNDNWNGNKHEFYTLRAARKAAKKEYGISVVIYDYKANIIEFSTASGHVPA